VLSATSPLLLIFSIYWLGLWTTYPYYVYHDYYAYCFAITVFLALVFTIIRNIYSYFMTLCGATNLHALTAERVLRGYSQFFDTNPIGKLITRFSKDQFLVDQKLNFNFIIFSDAFFSAVGSIIYAIITTPWAAIPSFILIFISFSLYRKCSNSLVIL
jgi:ABC-type multidrug transport system fused ATPase/permease subunit